MLISMVSPPFIASLAYIQLFGRNGLITKGVFGLSLNPYGWLGVVVMQTLFFSSLNALMIIGMLSILRVYIVENCCTTVKTGTTQLLFAFVYPVDR